MSLNGRYPTSTLGDIWLPNGVTYSPPKAIGHNNETGGAIVAHVFHFHDKMSGRRSKCTIPADVGESQAYIEDLAGTAFENWLVEIRTDGKKRAPTADERKQIGKAIRDFRAYANKRRQSSNSRIYYKGTQ